MDLSKLSDSDLLALKSGKLSNLSDAGLMQLKASAQPQIPAPQAEEPGMLASLGAGLGKGVGSVALGAQQLVGEGLNKLGEIGQERTLSSVIVKPKGNLVQRAGQWLIDDATQGKQNLQSQNAPYKAANPMINGTGEFGGEIIATLPVGGVLGAGAKAAGLTRLGTALGTSGMSTGGKVAEGLVPQAVDLGIRSLGAAGTGGASAALINPDDATTGAMIGALTPTGMKVLGAGASAAGAAVQPFFAKGQDRIAGKTLREFANDPEAALAYLKSAGQIVPGSAPTTAMAAGDSGIASLSRAMQNADTRYAAELAGRTTAQNQARTAALEEIAGNTGKIDIAKAARKAATDPMREAVLNAAGKVPADDVLSGIDRLIAKPDNAGKLSQQALNEFKSRIAANTQDGVVDARALYAIRKDINDVLGGKLQGETGNLKYASDQLLNVKGLIDDAIDKASRRAAPTGTDVMPFGGNLSTRTIPDAVSNGPRPSWSGYLNRYRTESIPINQMEKLDEVMKAIQTGSVDDKGSLILSGAKLNNMLKNQGSELLKTLDPSQLDVLRRISADLNAGQIANTSGRAVGSNTLQNLSQNQVLTGLLGNKIGGSTPVTSTIGRAMGVAYGTANKQISERLGNALLNPEEAARLMQTPEGNALLKSLVKGTAQVGYRGAPLLSAQ